jgi:methyltransferase (TIGR00027 family)
MTSPKKTYKHVKEKNKMSAKEASDHFLGSTAYWTAAVRAMEQARPDRLIDDPWAEALAGEVGAAWIAGRTPESVLPILLRTRYFDDFLGRISRENNIRQIVLVAAGLDTRAFRLDWPATTQVFEMDQLGVLEYKEQVLQSMGAQPACERHTLAADLTQPWKSALKAAGFDPQQPSGWLLEGFLFYLPNESIIDILEEANSLAAPGSWMGFDVMNSNTLNSPLTRSWVEMQAQSGAPFIGTLDDPQEFLSTRGWQASLTQAGAPDANHGRWTFPIIPTTMPNMPHNWFVTAQKT